MSSRVASPGVWLLFVLPWTALTVLADTFVISGMVHQSQVASWPSVQGTITRSEVEAVRSNKSTMYGLKVAYTYSVDGQPYEGTKVRASAWRSGNPGYAKELAERYPLGASIPVYYRPGQPSEAQLQAGMDSSELFLLLGLLPFNLVALFLVIRVGLGSKQEPPLLSTFVQEDGSECVMIDGPLTAPLVASLAMVGSSLTCLLLGGITGGFTAPPLVGVGAWGVVIACGVLARRWARARVKSGRYNLRLNPRTRSLSLPPFSGRKHRIDLRWRDVQSLRVEPQPLTPQGGKVSSYQVMLGLSTADGGVRQEAIAGFPREEQADALTHWLRTHLKVDETAPEELRSA